ncbi:MAG TPA: FGGY-family carbohydrate kinase [Spirochaetia bacterium]|nr:FGGY-family carbohydrate kinase [Spirochaetia bacterium]
MKLLLGIDIGTYSTKGMLVDLEGNIVAKAATAHEVAMPQDGWAEQDADGVWWNDLTVICRRLIEESGVDPREILGIGVSAIAPCVVPVDRNAKPLRPGILYGIDTRAVEQIRGLNRRLGEDWIREVSGSELSAQSAGPKILWIRENERELFDRSSLFLTSTSYLVYRLTGETYIDHYTAAFFGPLYNVRTLRWEPRGVEAVCRSDQLPDARWTTNPGGRVSREAAKVTGLAEGTPVIVGTADAAAEAVSAGVSQIGDTMLMYGSSLFIITLTPALSSGGAFWPAPFLFPGSSALAAGMATTGSITEWFKRNFLAEVQLPGTEQDREATVAFELLAREAAKIPPGSEGLLALPYFSGERTPINDPKARGVIAGLTLRHTRAHVYRAILEGVAYGIRHNLEAMSASGTSPKRLYSVGGGTKNREWMQIVSDVIGRPQLVRQSSGAAFGDAFLAGLGCGALPGAESLSGWLTAGEVIEPSASTASLYGRYYESFRALYRQTAETIHTLTELAGGSDEP